MADQETSPQDSCQDLEQLDQNTLVKKLLDAVNSSTELQSIVPDNVAQLLTNALSQVIHQQTPPPSIPPVQQGSTLEGSASLEDTNKGSSPPSDQLHRHYLTPADNVENTVEVSGYSPDQRPLGLKFPADVRRKIISMRKEGIKCKDIAKDLGASVSGVQKVWERFLATGTIKDRKASSSGGVVGGAMGRPRKYLTKQDDDINDSIGASSLCVPNTSVSVSTQAVLIDTREPMEVPGATVEVIASSTNDPLLPPLKKKSKHSYREELLMRLIDDCPLAVIKNDITMATSPHLLNLNESVNKPLYMEYVLGHPFGKAPLPRPFEADLEESKVILTDPSNPLGKEIIAALGYSTKVYFNACCKPSPLFTSDCYQCLPYSIGPNHIANTMREVLQVLVNLCADPVQGMDLIPKGPGPVLQTQTKTGEVLMTTFTPPTKLSEYWAQIYAYTGIFQCCENFLSPGPPSCPCLLCHPFESFAGSLDIREYSPVISPSNDHLSITTTDTVPQLLSTNHVEATSPVVMETPVIVSQEEFTEAIQSAVSEEVCITETTPLEEPNNNAVQLTTNDGIQYVAYNSQPPAEPDNSNSQQH